MMNTKPALPTTPISTAPTLTPAPLPEQGGRGKTRAKLEPQGCFPAQAPGNGGHPGLVRRHLPAFPPTQPGGEAAGNQRPKLPRRQNW
ncbi:MAG: hypothetical protein AAB767_02560 [Patescibacteria group bacterium]